MCLIFSLAQSTCFNCPGSTLRQWDGDVSVLLSPKEESFQKAAEEVKVLKKKPDNAELSDVYALYKQVTVGDVNVGESLGPTWSLNLQITSKGLLKGKKTCCVNRAEIKAE